MARLFTSASSQALTKNSWTGTLNYPYSMFCWAYFTTVAANQIVQMIDNNATGGNYASLYMNTSDKTIRAGDQAGGYAEAVSGGTVAAGAWYHLGHVGISSASRTVYLNGTGTNNTTTQTMGLTIAKLVLGAAYASTTTLSSFLNGRIAFPAYWTVALSATDIGALKAGASPRKIQPASLVSYCRLTGAASPEPDMCSSTAWTLTGAPTETPNPLIFPP